SDYRLSSRFGDQSNDQSQGSLYAQAVIPASEVLDVTLGVRYAEVENELQDTGMFAIFPDGIRIEDDVTVGTFGLAIKADQNWRVLFRADQNYRFAKVDEYLQPVFTPTFTPEILKTQQGLSVETGVEWQAGGNNARLMIYQLDIDDEIAYDPVNFANINLDQTRRKGVISSGYWQQSNKLGYTASYTFTDAEVLRGAFAGKDIPLVAMHSLLLGSDYQLTDKWQLYGELFAISDRVFAGDFNNVLGRLPGYGLVNIKAAYEYNDFSLSARINNLFNKAYSDVGQLSYDSVTFVEREAFFTSPGINFMLTAAWQFR
ncbi:MAG: TonB-dependent receptor, partial [Gammaproteobacteria bacterium]|nr:TonB-dependent receptor [Gammaproteobacteria bacterium]